MGMKCPDMSMKNSWHHDKVPASKHYQQHCVPRYCSVPADCTAWCASWLLQCAIWEPDVPMAQWHTKIEALNNTGLLWAEVVVYIHIYIDAYVYVHVYMNAYAFSRAAPRFPTLYLCVYVCVHARVYDVFAFSRAAPHFPTYVLVCTRVFECVCLFTSCSALSGTAFVYFLECACVYECVCLFTNIIIIFDELLALYLYVYLHERDVYECVYLFTSCSALPDTVFVCVCVCICVCMCVQ